VILHKTPQEGFAKFGKEVKEGKQKFWNSPYKVSGDHSFGTYCPHMAASDFFSPHDVAIGAQFSF
jgi:hypothetical protein